MSDGADKKGRHPEATACGSLSYVGVNRGGPTVLTYHGLGWGASRSFVVGFVAPTDQRKGAAVDTFRRLALRKNGG